jgi:serine-aspartate repeat-containing protein C/D/E
MKSLRVAQFNPFFGNARSTGKARRSRSKSQVNLLSSVEVLEDRTLMAGDFAGTIFNDLNSNGVKDATDNGLAGWTLFADTNNDGRFNTGEPTAVTDVKGKFTILGLPAGNVTIYEVVEPGFKPTPGFSDHQIANIRDGRTTKSDFPNVTAPITTGQIVGTVFEDTNENGIKESGEHGLSGWTMFVDTNGDGSLTAGEPTATTDTDGGYVIGDVPAGSASVYEIPQGGYAPISGGLFPMSGATTHHEVTVVAGGSVRTDFANLIPPVGTIQGTVWNDANGDGLRGADEVALAGQTVYIDLDNNGQQDATDPARITDANGAYAFANIHTGNYRVVDVIPAEFIAADNRAATAIASVFRGSLNTVDFYNLTPTTGSVSGVLFNDLDGNGLRSATEPGLADWQVYVDLNLNGTLDAGDLSTITDTNGAFNFSGLAYGNVTLRDIVPATWISTSPVAAASTIHLLNGENRAGFNFGNRERIGTIQGTVWNDANGDGLRGATETGLADSAVFLDLNNDGIQDATEPAALTDAAGQYTFSRVPVGTYRIVEVLPSGWITSVGKPSAVTTTLGIGGVNVADFYNLTPVPGTISGTVWSDADSNGVIGTTEPGLEGWQVYVDVNLNGVLDPADPQATTDATGAYTISGVPYGSTTIREVVQAGITSTTAAVIDTLLLNGEDRVGVNFGNHEPTDYTISGIAFNDANKNGVRDLGEIGVSGVTVFIDSNNNGVLDPAEPMTTTATDLFYTPAVNEIGTYSFTHLARGTYHVVEVVPATLEGTPATVRDTFVSVGPTSQLNVDFADQYRANEIHGVVFDDTNANGVYDAQEHARSGVSVYIDVNRDDVYETDEPHAVTGADGSYAFVNLTPGAYIVREDQGTTVGPHTYPQTGGGILWPEGVSHPAVGNVSPTSITTSLADGESYTQTVSLTLPQTGTLTNLVDVFLLFDDTGSFTANSPIVRAAFPTIIDTLQASLPGIDLGFGVGRFEEYANFASEFSTGRPFILNQPIVANSTPGSAAAIQSALDRVAPGYGGDTPETDIEALYQLVTGAGFDGNANGSVLDSGVAGSYSTQVTPGDSGDVPSFASFTADTANGVMAGAGNVGGGGFRTGALPIVLLATDTGFAYQPQGETSITGTGGVTLPLSALTQMSRTSTPSGTGAGIQQTVTGLNALGALVIGLGTNPDAASAPRSSLEALSQLTGAVNRSTTTIANGTADTIAPGDPLYFQIGAGFGSTVADGVVNAIQNAVTNVAMDITVRASDPRVHIINHTGTLAGIGAGQTASFDFEFIGDGRPHRFDLEFVRAGTNVVLGSIPVVLGTPVTGEGYSYEQLDDGDIHHSSHFGNYVENVAPSFVGGTDVTVLEDAGTQSVTTWATSISVGPANEANQTVDFLVENDNPGLFNTQPTISADGTLTFTPAINASGSALVTVRLHDNGGIGLSGADTSASQTFRISVTAVNDAPVSVDDSYSTTEGAALVVAGSGVLGNDTDVEGAALTANLISAPAHGVLTLNVDGSFHYTPDAGYFGTDRFSYVANDGSLNSNVATVAITVTQQPGSCRRER